MTDYNYYGLYNNNLEQQLIKNISINNNKLKVKNTIGEDKYNNIIEIVYHFIKSKKRIISGEIAINQYLYKDENYSHDNNEIIIYSPSPKRDVVELINIIDKENIQYLSGYKSDYYGSYTISIYFQPIIKISYFPQNIFNSLPTFKSNGFFYPEISFLKNIVLSSLSSNRLLTKEWDDKYSEYLQLNENSPYERPSGFLCNRNSSSINQKIKIIIDLVKDISIITLSYAYQTYKKQSDLIDLFPLTSSYLSIYHPNPENLIKKIKKELSKDSIIIIKKHEPFLNYFPELYEIYWDDIENPILEIYNSSKLCIPYRTFSNIKIVSLCKLLVDVKIKEFLSIINNDEKNKKLYQCMAYEIDRMNRTTITTKNISKQTDLSSIFSLTSNNYEGIK